LLWSLSHTGYQKCSLLWTHEELALISICELSSRTSSSLNIEAICCLEMTVTNYSCRSEISVRTKYFCGFVQFWDYRICSERGVFYNATHTHTHTRPCCPDTEALVVQCQNTEDESRRTGSRCNLVSLLTSYRASVLFFAKVCFRQIN